MKIRLLLLSTLITFSLAAQEKEMPKDEPVETIAEEPLQEQKQEEDKNTVFVVVEQAPEYPEGFVAMNNFIKKNLKYPAVDKRKGVEGTVYVAFVVNKDDGHLENINVVKGVSAAIDQEALRIISSMPKWKPGKQNGRAVNSKFVVPVKFAINPK